MLPKRPRWTIGLVSAFLVVGVFLPVPASGQIIDPCGAFPDGCPGPEDLADPCGLTQRDFPGPDDIPDPCENPQRECPDPEEIEVPEDLDDLCETSFPQRECPDPFGGPCDSPIEERICTIIDTVEDLQDPTAGVLAANSPTLQGVECAGSYGTGEAKLSINPKVAASAGPLVLEAEGVQFEAQGTLVAWRFDCWATSLRLGATAHARPLTIEREVHLQLDDTEDGQYTTVDYCAYRTIEEPTKDSCSVSVTLPGARADPVSGVGLNLPMAGTVCVQDYRNARAIEKSRLDAPPLTGLPLYVFGSQTVDWDDFGSSCRTVGIEWTEVDDCAVVGVGVDLIGERVCV